MSIPSTFPIPTDGVQLSTVIVEFACLVWMAAGKPRILRFDVAQAAAGHLKTALDYQIWAVGRVFLDTVRQGACGFHAELEVLAIRTGRKSGRSIPGQG